jgi:hypothetical protein
MCTQPTVGSWPSRAAGMAAFTSALTLWHSHHSHYCLELRWAAIDLCGHLVPISKKHYPSSAMRWGSRITFSHPLSDFLLCTWPRRSAHVFPSPPRHAHRCLRLASVVVEPTTRSVVLHAMFLCLCPSQPSSHTPHHHKLMTSCSHPWHAVARSTARRVTPR